VWAGFGKTAEHIIDVDDGGEGVGRVVISGRGELFEEVPVGRPAFAPAALERRVAQVTRSGSGAKGGAPAV